MTGGHRSEPNQPQQRHPTSAADKIAQLFQESLDLRKAKHGPGVAEAAAPSSVQLRLPKLPNTHMTLVDASPPPPLLHHRRIAGASPSMAPAVQTAVVAVAAAAAAASSGAGPRQAQELPAQELPALELTELEKLERFDDWWQFETHSPEEWVALYREDPDHHAFVYHYSGSQTGWTFVPCWVRGYSKAEGRRFQVELFDGSRKAVKRLRLRFKGESEASFAHRLASAETLKQAAELEREFTNLVLTDGRFSGPARVVKTGDSEEVRNQKIWADRLGVALRVITPEERAKFAPVLEKYQQKTNSGTAAAGAPAAAKGGAAALKERSVWEKAFRAAYGRWFETMQGQAKQGDGMPSVKRGQLSWLDTHRGALGRYPRVVLRVGGEKMLDERIKREREGTLEMVDGSMSPDAFVEKLCRHRDMVTYALDSEWRGAILAGIMENPAIKFDFFTNKMEQYEHHPIRTFIAKVQLMMNVKLRELLELSLLNFTKFMLEFSEEAHGGAGGACLLLELRAASASGTVTLEPSVETIQAEFAATISSILQSAQSLPGIEKQLLPCLAEIQDKPLISEQALAELQSAVEKSVQVASHVLGDCLRGGPTDLLRRYERFGELAAPGGGADADVDVESGTSLEAVRTRIARVQQLQRELVLESADYVDFALYRVDAAELKKFLTSAARKTLTQIAETLVEFVQNELGSLEGEWLAIIDRIASVPKDEKSLAELKDFLLSLQSAEGGSSNPMSSLLTRERHARACVATLLDQLRDARGLELETRLLEHLHWPATVGVAVAQRFRRIEAEKTKFTSRLEEEKAKLVEDLASWKSELSTIVETFTEYGKATEYAVKVNGLYEKLQEGIRRVEDFNRREEVFGVELSSKTAIEAMLETYEPYYRLWVLVSDWRYAEEEWTGGSLIKLKADEVRGNVDNWWRGLFKMQKTWTTKVANESPAGEANSEGSQSRRQLQVVDQAIEGISLFKEKLLPIIEAVCHDSFVMRHWIELFDVVEAEELQQAQAQGGLGARSQTTTTPNANDIDVSELTLTGLLELGISRHLAKVEDIAGSARKEWSLRRGLQNMKIEWKGVLFELLAYKETGTSVIRGTDEIQVLLDDHIVKTQAIRGSPYSKSFEKEAKEWEAKLLYIQEALDAVLNCQKTWLYLEPIFGSEDIVRQMPGEARKFGSVDQLWRNTIGLLKENGSVLDFSEIENLLVNFQEAVKRLDEIGKGLNDYLETKRMAFPRFYFLSNDELLSILSETKDPERVQPHLSKCFEGIHRVVFAHDRHTGSSRIEALVSSEGERVKLIGGGLDVNAGENKGAVEKWLGKLEKLMVDSLVSITDQSVKAYAVQGDTERDKWVLEWPGQVVLATDMIFYTREVTSAIERNQLPEYLNKLNRQLDGVVKLVRGDLNPLGRRTLAALTTIDVHNRDVVAQLVQEKVADPEGFEWLSQMRYYWQLQEHSQSKDPQSSRPLWVAMVNSRLAYTFEYLGNSDRLVVTPLTDRCYRTLMGAYHLFYGAGPEGPAGTGKTESCKDLAKACAIQCVVFNCSDGMDYLSMGKFFKGLASSGAWCCFDEFNRINVEVLSVIAQQVLTIQLAIRERKTEFVFEGVQIKLVASCAVNITMNPGYAGRAELPDNLKALFRPCAMMVPDYNLIAEIYLYGVGMENSRAIGRKAVQALKLSSEQLSSQDHYDFGMRGLKSILVAAGQLKRKFGDSISEFAIALRAFLDVNVPKFTANDIPLFKGIVGDLFPGVELPEVDNSEFIAEIQTTTQSLGLVCTENHMLKVTQLWETLLVRHGLMTVGGAPCGKSAVLQTLAVAMEKLSAKAKQRGVSGDDNQYKEIVKYVINPKSVKSTELYGSFDDATHEWSDGIIAISVRTASKADQDGRRHWIVLDGPVDAVWVENMNSVLDDNKKLCLLSGEIIKLSPLTNMMFEVADLSVASPATVSRCGMVFMEPANLAWRVIVRSHLANELTASAPAETSEAASAAAEKGAALLEQFTQLYDRHFEGLWTLVRKECRNIISVNENWLALSSARLLMALVNKFKLLLHDGQSGRNPDLIEQVFTFALLWSVGGCVDEAGRAKVDAYFQASAAESRGSLYDVYLSEQGEWAPWVSLIEKTEISKGVAFHQIIVPTKDTVRNQYMLELCLNSGLNVLLTGGTGRGKTVCVSHFLSKVLSKEQWTSLSFAFSAQTSASQTQDIIDGKLDKRRKGVFGPPVNKRMVLFVDDLNMPQKEVYGAQPPIELLRQCLSQSGWYDRKTFEFRRIVDVNFVAAVGGNKADSITARYLWYYNAIGVLDYAEDSLARIFGTMVTHFYKDELGASVGEDVLERLVRGAIEVYGTVVKELLPTPSKSHYLFNLRDLSKVFQGITLPKAGSGAGKAVTAEGVGNLVSLWRHELERVFGDRLVSSEDRSWFAGVLDGKATSLFGEDAQQAMLSGEDGVLMYTDMVSGKYERVRDVAKLLEKTRDALADYNRQSKYAMNLVLFVNFVEHVTRVVRVLRLPLGNMLNVGVGGSGRKSVTNLASHIVGYELFSIEVTKSYGKKEWQEDLKRVLVKAGAQDQQTTFLLSDTQLPKEAFYEDVNNLLNTGEVPNLFNAEEKNAIIDMCAKTAKQDANANTPQEVFAWFVSICRRNLHAVLCMSPIGEGFRRRLRNYPSLVNCCTIDWYLDWPREALVAVAEQFLGGQIPGSDAQQAGITRVCAVMQEEATRLTQEYRAKEGRYFYVTPTSYLDLVRSFRGLLTAKIQQVQMMKRRYDGGIDKLNATAQQVATMQKELEELQPVLKRTAQENAEMMQVITVKKKEAEVVKANVAVEEQEANKAAHSAMTIKEECERDLGLALPALEAAMDALNKLSKADITEVKAMNNPPTGVVLVSEALCIMFGIPPKKEKAADGKGKVDNYWEPAKKQLFGDAKLITRLLEYDKDNIAPDVIKKITPFEADPNFDPEMVRKASMAAYGICKWVRAMIVYDRVARDVQPKRDALHAAETAFAEANEKLQTKKRELREVEERVAVLEAQLEASVQKQDELKRQVEDCKVKLSRADKLIGGLGGERTRWTQSSKALGETMENVTGDVLIASGHIAYLGAFPGKYRTLAVRKWTEALRREGIPVCTGTYNLSEVVGDQVKIRQWVIDKLPNDSVSIDNAIIMQNSTRWPLMIDPQLQANRWIKNTYAAKKGSAAAAATASSGLKVIRLSQPDYSRTLETAIQFGFPVLIENVLETMDPLLEPLLNKSISKAGSLNMIKLGDTTIEYSDDFRLYLTTKLPNPHYAPEVCVTVTILNFSTTYEGLSDQLLSLLVAAEEPEKEKRRQDLVVESAASKAQLKEIEDKILELLSSSKGNILDDEELIDTLSNSKVASQRIEERVVVQERTAKEIQETRLWYSPVAERSAKLFFVVSDLAGVEATYQYSLQWFVGIYLTALSTAERARGEQRLKNLNAEFMKRLYSNVCRSLFEKHKLLFSFLMAVRMLEFDKELDQEALRVLLTGAAAGGDEAETVKKPEGAAWVTEAMWSKLNVVSRLSGGSRLEKLAEKFVQRVAEWKKVFDSEDPVKTLQQNAARLMVEKLSSLETALVLLALRPDGLIRGVQGVVAGKLGSEYLEPPPFNLEVYFQDSKPTIPLIFVLTSGADPMTELLKLAEKQQMKEKIRLISLGQGQGPKANRMISECSQSGGWVVLQNCHLATSYMPVLEGLVENFGDPQGGATGAAEASSALHPEFRLWLTTMPSADFPVSVLQNGIKMTVEPPKGLKQNLQRAYLALEDKWLESSSKPSTFKDLLFSLCLFHSVVLERRKFGPLGWNIQYQFSDADRQISASQLQIFLEEFKQVPYEALNYMVAEANYGGRVTDAHDRRTIVAILRDFLNKDVKSGYVLSGVYKIPETTDRQGYLNVIKALPLNETTDVFGLHPNANLTASISEGMTLLSTALGVLGGAGGGGGGAGVDLEQASRIATAILNQLPAGGGEFDIETVSGKFPPKYDESMNTVLVQELLRFNKLTRVIKASLTELQKAVKGLVVMTPELQAVGVALLESRVPEVWKAASYPSLKPLLSYVADLNKRLQFLGDWVQAGHAPTSFWISGFFFTQGFLTGTLQNFSRRFKHPIDTCMWNFQVMPRDWQGPGQEPPLKGAYVYGLYMQGARWDELKDVVAEAEPKVLFDTMPFIWLKPVENSHDETPSAFYACPLYKTSERRGVLSTTGHSTNFVMMANLPIDAQNSTSRLWVKRGVAMLTQLDN